MNFNKKKSLRLFANYKPRNFNYVRGFTIAELLVSIFIIVLIGSGLYISSSRFSENSVLTNLAYDVSATIRQVQTYGLSVKNWQKNWAKEVADPLRGFDAGYGIRFGYDQDKQFALFFETNSNPGGGNNWRCGNSTETPPIGVSGCDRSTENMSLYQISGRNTISKVCAIATNTTDNFCFSPGISGTGSEYLDIIFKRSDPDQPGLGTLIDAFFSTSAAVYPNTYQSAEITLKTPNEFEKTIVVTAIGQIYIK